MTSESVIPGQYDHIARQCTHCGDVGPFRRPAKSCDPFRCVRCNQPERYAEPEQPKPNLAVAALRELEAAVTEAPPHVNGNGAAQESDMPASKPDTAPGLFDAARELIAEHERRCHGAQLEAMGCAEREWTCPDCMDSEPERDDCDRCGGNGTVMSSERPDYGATRAQREAASDPIDDGYPVAPVTPEEDAAQRRLSDDLTAGAPECQPGVRPGLYGPGNTDVDLEAYRVPLPAEQPAPGQTHSRRGVPCPQQGRAIRRLAALLHIANAAEEFTEIERDQIREHVSGLRGDVDELAALLRAAKERKP